MRLTVAAVSWRLEQISGTSQFERHFWRLIEASGDSDVVVLPELPVLELLHLHPATLEQREVPGALEGYADLWEGLVLEAAKGRVVIGGSHVRGNRNVCLIAGPDLEPVVQEKVKLTQWEKSEWGLEAGSGLRLPPGLPLGVLICYDSEFPEAGRALAEAGALIQCVPSFTETQAGFHRVRWSCQARSVENQVFTVHASLVGDLGREPVPGTFGTSAIIAPPVEPFGHRPILAETEPQKEGVAVAELDLEVLLGSRQAGDVRNWEDRAPNWKLLT